MKSVVNISKITRGMQMVAASKMRKAQQEAMAGKVYAQKILKAVGELCAKTDPKLHPLLRQGDKRGKILVILISTNKGLCGGLNTNLFKAVHHWFFQKEENSSSSIVFITMGRKGREFVIKTGRQLIADFSRNYPFIQDVPALTSLIVDGFLKGEYRQVFLVFNEFISVFKQRPLKKPLLPLTTLEFLLTAEEKLPIWGDFLIEPSPVAVLNSLLPHYLEIEMRSAILEAEAGEHSARMMAMKNATDNAVSLSAELSLEYNKARQETITNEIADITRAREVMK